MNPACFKCAAGAGMTHQLLNDFHVFSIADEKRRECVSKGMPSYSFLDAGSQCRRANNLLQQSIWPERVLSLRTGARKYPVVGLPIPGGLFPQPEISGYTLMHRDRLA
jgi:hypothetical protein